MQLAGQIWGQRPHATHLALPCSSVSIRCVPRQRGEMVQSAAAVCSGYCIVTFGRNRWLNVSAMPFTVARRYDTSPSCRWTALTPIATLAPCLCGTADSHPARPPDQPAAVQAPQDYCQEHRVEPEEGQAIGE